MTQEGEKGEVVLDPGVADKRVLVVEEELAKVLKQSDRSGNILSEVLRSAWDGKTLASMTRAAPLKATGAHVSINAHITKDELRKTLTGTDIANGFGNRFLWVCAKRSKLLPHGGNPDPEVMAELHDALADAVAFAATVGEVVRDADAEDMWTDVYGALDKSPRSGAVDSLLARDAPHIVRLSLIYAMLNKSAVVRVEHLEAAVAAWQYCEDSVQHLFGSSTGNPVADKIAAHLQATPSGATRTEIRELIGARVPAEKIESALAVLQGMRLARPEQRATAGRSSESWTATHTGGATRG